MHYASLSSWTMILCCVCAHLAPPPHPAIHSMLIPPFNHLGCIGPHAMGMTSMAIVARTQCLNIPTHALLLPYITSCKCSSYITSSNIRRRFVQVSHFATQGRCGMKRRVCGVTDSAVSKGALFVTEMDDLREIWRRRIRRHAVHALACEHSEAYAGLERPEVNQLRVLQGG